MDFKESFKKNLKSVKEGLEFSSNPSSLFEGLSSELGSEIESNKVLKFKKSLRESVKGLKVNRKPFDLFDELPKEATAIELIREDTIEEIEYLDLEPIVNINQNLILNAVESITKEESSKPKEEVITEYTNLFSQPNSKLETTEIKLLQKKLKFLEDWVTKISMTGPGGGAGDAVSLSYPVTIVDSDYTMNRKDYCLLVDPSVKTYINLPPAYDERRIIIKDISGHAHLTPIHINGTIDNDSNGAEIRVKYASLQLIYKNDSWWII